MPRPRPSSPPPRSTQGWKARLALGLGIALLSGGIYWLLTAPRFVVRDAVLGVPDFCREALRPVLPVGRNIFLVRTGPLKAALAGDPRVGSVRMTRLWPDRVEITVIERRPVGRVWFEEEAVAVDAAGRILGPASPGDGLPLLHGAIYRPDGSVDPEQIRMAARVLAAADSSGLPRVTKVDFLPEGRVNLACEGVLLVKLGRPENLEQKLVVASSALDLYGASDLAYVDVELREQPAVKFRGNDQ